METNTRKRRVLGVPIIGWIIGATLGLGVVAAVAAFIILGTINGSVTTGTFQVFGTAGQTVADGNETAGTCVVALTSAGDGTGPTYSVNWTGGAIAGDTCVATLGVQGLVGNAQLPTVQAVNIGPAITGGEVTAELLTSCGATIPDTPVAITVTFTITTAADPGTVYDLTGTAIEFVPASTYNAGACS